MISTDIRTVDSISPRILSRGRFARDHQVVICNDTTRRLYVGNRNVTSNSGIVVRPGETLTLAGITGDDLYGVIGKAKLRWCSLKKIDVETDIRVLTIAR